MTEKFGFIRLINNMETYVRVDWPESQEWEEDNTYVFVPEELYNRVKGK